MHIFGNYLPGRVGAVYKAAADKAAEAQAKKDAQATGQAAAEEEK